MHLIASRKAFGANFANDGVGAFPTSSSSPLLFKSPSSIDATALLVNPLVFLMSISASNVSAFVSMATLVISSQLPVLFVRGFIYARAFLYKLCGRNSSKRVKSTCPPTSLTNTATEGHRSVEIAFSSPSVAAAASSERARIQVAASQTQFG